MKNKILLLIAFAFWCGAVSAQDRTITGKVTDKAGNAPLAGATVLADKTKTATTTAADGTYSITVGKKSTALIISYVGYTTQTITIGDNRVINVSLATSGGVLDEAVVIGYGSQKKRNVTGAVSSYKNDNIDEAPVSRLDQALQGKIAGVQIQNLTSEAGSDPRIKIRGGASLTASTDPLVVVDGHPVPDGLQFVNMADVASVEVLKDAASAAIYGSRGANGVIIVTTKSGKANKPKFNVKISTGFKDPYETYPMMTTSEYTNMLYYEASLKAMDPAITPPTGTAVIANNERAAYIIENTIMGGHATDWQKEALRNGFIRNVQLNVSGGNKDVRYYLSAAAQKDQGMMYHSEYDKYSFRGKIDAQLSKKLKASVNINPTYIKRERPSVNYIDFVRFQSFMPVYHNDATAAFVTQASQWAGIRPGDFVQARHFNGRFYSGYMPDGTFYTSTAALDPFNTANNTPKSVMETRTITNDDYRILTSGDLTYTIIPGLDLKVMGSAYAAYSKSLDFAKAGSFKDGDPSRGAFGNKLTIDLLSENTLTYTKQIKDHSLTALAGFTVQKTNTKDEQTTGINFTNDDIKNISTASQIDLTPTATYSLRDQVGLVSYLGRILYSYKNKYLLNVSFRKDGSSKFAPGHKWGNFPAASLGWIATEEKFLSDVKWLNNLKVRASYGLSGNNNIYQFAYLDLLYTANYPLGSAANTTVVQGQGPSNIPTTQIPTLGDRDLTWERTYQFNTGFDAILFKNLVNVSFDYYNTRTEKLLLRVPALGTTGYSYVWDNAGRITNNGVEAELTLNQIRKKHFRWSTVGNIAFNKSKLTDLGGAPYLFNQGERTELYYNTVGAPPIQFYGYKTDGVWLSQAQIDDAKAKGLTSNLSNLFVPGGLKLVDFNGDNVIDEKDRTVIGNPYPKYTWGITNNFTIRNFDLSFTFQGSQGGQLVNGDPNYNETKRYNRNYNTNRWLSPAFPGDGKTPYSTIGFNWMLTDYVVEDASYYALREVIVGYSLSKEFAKKLKMSNVRLYFSGQNLYYHFANGYRGINPEARFLTGPYSTPLVDGYQRGSFPINRAYVIGIDFSF